MGGRRLTEYEKEYILKKRVAGWGIRRIGKDIGRAHTTVRTFLHEYSGIPDGPMGKKPQKKNHQNNQGPAEKFDWMIGLDKSGEAMLGLFAKAIRENDERKAMGWMDRFIKAYQAYTGGQRVLIYHDQRTQIDSHVEITAGEVLSDLRDRLEAGGICPVCGEKYKNY